MTVFCDRWLLVNLSIPAIFLMLDVEIPNIINQHAQWFGYVEHRCVLDKLRVPLGASDIDAPIRWYPPCFNNSSALNQTYQTSTHKLLGIGHH